MGRVPAMTVTATVMLCFWGVLDASHGVAEESARVSFKSPAEDKYTQQQNIEVGDMPNHVVRSFELHRTYSDNEPVINGLRLVEEWDRGIADYVKANGRGTVYSTYLMENGDKFFARTALLVQTDSERLIASNVGIITGGTGKFAGMQGIVRMSTGIEAKTKVNYSQTEIEYSIGR
jgi:hypothetical protein